jgi:hypothetical protein
MKQIITTEQIIDFKSGEVIKTTPWIFSRLFAKGQTFIIDSKRYEVVSCSIHGYTVKTVVK